MLLSSFANRLSSQGSEASHGKKTWCYVSFLEQQHRAFTWTWLIWLYLVSHPDIYNSMYISISLVLFAIHLFHPNAKVDHTRTNSHHSRCQSTHIATSTEMSCILESFTALSYNNTKNLSPNWKKLNCSWNQRERKEGLSPKPLPIDEYFELNRDNQCPGELLLPFHTTTTQNIPQKCIKVIYFRMQMVECSLAGSWCGMLRKYQNWELMTFMEFEDMYTVITWSFHHNGLYRVNAPREFHCAPTSLQAVYSQRFVRICNMDNSGTDTG